MYIKFSRNIFILYIKQIIQNKQRYERFLSLNDHQAKRKKNKEPKFRKNMLILQLFIAKS